MLCLSVMSRKRNLACATVARDLAFGNDDES